MEKEFLFVRVCACVCSRGSVWRKRWKIIIIIIIEKKKKKKKE